jgi:hypothetical protein
MPRIESQIKKLIDDLGINEEFTKSVKKPTKFTHVKDNVPLKEDMNFMADLLFLPTTEEGYKYCLVVVDLASNEFDIEPLRTKEPKEVLQALKTMFKRNYIHKPEYTIQTDNGNEFKGVFDKWLYDESILHKTTVPDRHSQNSNVESLNKQLGRLFNGYMNKIEEKTGKRFNEWTNIVETVREELNKIRKQKLPKDWVDYDYADPTFDTKPKYKVGDIVYRQLEAPKDALGHDQPTKNFRMGDYRWDIKQPRKIVQVIPYAGDVPWRYLLEGLNNVSFTKDQLKLAPENEKESKFIVERILQKKTVKKKDFYLIKWKKQKVSEAGWESKEKLIEDGIGDMIDEFEESIKDKKPKKVNKKGLMDKIIEKVGQAVNNEEQKTSPVETTGLRRSSRLANKK